MAVLFVLVGFFLVNETCHKPFQSSLRSTFKAEKLRFTTQELRLWADIVHIAFGSGFNSSKDPSFATATRI